MCVCVCLPVHAGVFLNFILCYFLGQGLSANLELTPRVSLAGSKPWELPGSAPSQAWVFCFYFPQHYRLSTRNSVLHLTLFPLCYLVPRQDFYHFFKLESGLIAQAGLEPMILLCQPPEGWDYYAWYTFFWMFMCMGIVCIFLCTAVRLMTTEARRGSIPRTAVTVQCKPPCRRWQWNSDCLFHFLLLFCVLSQGFFV